MLLVDVKIKVEAASQLRDNLEHYISGPIYPAFLKKLVPIFVQCLKGPPVFISTSAEQVYTRTFNMTNESDLLIETAELCPRNSPPSAFNPSRVFRTIRRGNRGSIDGIGTG
jgi:hypothetical protein